MRYFFVLLAAWSCIHAAAAQDTIHFASPAGSVGSAATQLDGYLFRAQAQGPRPAVVFLHGCGGLVSPLSHQIMAREMDWAGRLTKSGISVLMVDSFAPRGSGEMCSRTGYKDRIYKARPGDAYAALTYLQSQPFVAKDRIGLIGWSNGGGATLLTIGERSSGRPKSLDAPDFRAAVAFYPGSCSTQRLGADWTTKIPLLVLIGQEDVWTPMKPCRQLIEGAAQRGSPVAFHAYPGAYHDFDWPGLKRHELQAYVTRDGVVPITGEEPAAHADAIERVRAFFGTHLLH
jgi:dienelactone hydrolase